MGNPGNSLGFTFPHVKPLISVFFKHLPPEKLAEEIFDAQGDSKLFIENLINEHYDVLRHVTRVVYYGFLGSRARHGGYGSKLNIDLDDYLNIACLCIFEKLPERLRLDSTPGEIVTCLCLWLEQKVKRALMGEIENEYCKKELSSEALVIASTQPKTEESDASDSEDLDQAADEDNEDDEAEPTLDVTEDSKETGAYKQQLHSMRVHSFSDEDILAVIDRLQSSDVKDTQLDLLCRQNSLRGGETQKKTSSSYLWQEKKNKSRGAIRALAGSNNSLARRA